MIFFSDSGGIYLKSCEDSWFGCCPDHKTPATGPDNEGCPSMCGCNKIGKNELYYRIIIKFINYKWKFFSRLNCE